MKKVVDKSREELRANIKNATNLFFYIGYQVIPVSYILESLINQIDSYRSYLKKETITDLLNYKNDFQKVRVRSTKDNLSKVRLAKDNQNLVKINPQLKVYLPQIKLQGR